MLFSLRCGSRDFEKRGGGVLCRPSCSADAENNRFQMVSKTQNNVRNYKFFAKYFYKYFQIFSIFIYNERLLVKSYQFLKIYKRFDKERERAICSSQWEKKNWEKLEFFITGSFIKPLKIAINRFSFNSYFCSQDFSLFRKLVSRTIFALKRVRDMIKTYSQQSLGFYFFTFFSNTCKDELIFSSSGNTGEFLVPKCDTVLLLCFLKQDRYHSLSFCYYFLKGKNIFHNICGNLIFKFVFLGHKIILVFHIPNDNKLAIFKQNFKISFFVLVCSLKCMFR